MMPQQAISVTVVILQSGTAIAATQMDEILVLVFTGSDKQPARFSRVPIVGEFIKLRERNLQQTYVVRSVTHTPNTPYAAEISVSLAD